MEINGIEFDSLKHQNEYVNTFYYDANKLSMEQRKEITRQQVLGLIGELVEFQEGIKLLPWKSGQYDINYDNSKEDGFKWKPYRYRKDKTTYGKNKH